MNFQNQIDYLPTMFDDFIIPKALDRETVISNIVKRCGLLTPLYSEPYMTKAALDLWFSSNQWTLSHLVNIIEAEYSPIENVDRHDQQTREIGRDLSRSDQKTNKITDTGSSSGTETRHTDAETTVNASNEAIDSVSPYDTDDWSNSSKRDEDNRSTTSTDGTERVTDSRSDKHSTQADETGNGTENEKTIEKFIQHMHGNIGVTTNQQMINQELDLMQRFHLYEWIAIEIQSDLFLSLY